MHTNLKLPRVTAHRGGAAHAPENTLTAICSAGAADANWIEIDVSLLGDGTAVVFHDERLNRCTNGDGLLREQTLNSIRQLDAGSWFHPRFAGERIPTLEDARELVQELDLNVNLEIKLHSPEQREPLTRQLESLCRQGLLRHERTLLSSFDLGTLRHLRTAGCTLPMAPLFGVLPEDWFEQVRDLDPVSINLDHTRVTGAQISEIVDHGLHVQLYTVNEPEAVAALRNNPRVGIITDDPIAFANW